MLPLLFALVASVASAGEKNVATTDEVTVIAVPADACPDVVVVQTVAAPVDPPKPAPQRHPLRFQSSILQADDGAPWLAGQFRLVGRKDAYVGVEGRIGTDKSWIGRVGAGFDILGKSDWDLKLGLFLGGVGTGFARDEALVVGTEVGVGMRIGRLYGQYRWLAGLGTRFPQVQGLHTEHDLILGFRIFDQFRVFGQAIYSWPGSGYGATALGLGIALRI